MPNGADHFVGLQAVDLDLDFTFFVPRGPLAQLGRQGLFGGFSGKQRPVLGGTEPAGQGGGIGLQINAESSGGHRLAVGFSQDDAAAAGDDGRGAGGNLCQYRRLFFPESFLALLGKDFWDGFARVPGDFRIRIHPRQAEGLG